MTESKATKWGLPALLVVLALGGAYAVGGGLFGGDDDGPQDTSDSSTDESADVDEGGDEDRETPRVEALSVTDQKIADTENAVRFHQERGTWLDLARAGMFQVQLARLSGKWSYYGDAQASIARAFEVADEGPGPIEEAMSLAFTMHEFDELDRLIAIQDATGLTPGGQRSLDEMKADLALARGRYDEARAAYETMVERERSVGNLTRLAFLQANTGDAVAADATFAQAIEAATRDSEFQIASLELQRGLLDLEHERYDAARAHYETARQAFPGWYLVEEHLAEAMCELDECERALPIYEDVVARTGSPELMGALAETLETLGRPEDAAPWWTRADETYDELIEQYPEALGGHGLEHFLDRASPERALELARRNHALRADGEAQTLLIRALLGADEVAEARRVLAQVLASPYRTPTLFEVAAEVEKRAGNEAASEAHAATRQQMLDTFAAAFDDE